MSVRLLVATSNAGKMRELAALFADLPVTLVSLQDLPVTIPPPDETGETCADNARLKATAYAIAAGLPCLAEDSGFEVEALGGAPGVRSARVPGGSDEARNAWVYAQLDARGSRDSKARFVSVLALATATGEIVHVAEGEVAGTIAPEPRGSNGFGYDPMLFYAPLGRTFAELTMEEKASVSHRGRAARLMHDWIGAHLDTLAGER
ncbi:non-canonical purine NTP pyrophosphatase [Luteitalea sp. TBR-22]|uniref:non-canonical purine NTP pyrophosphatase n=1 Tax=Luteitalea sp. TBR-22 TaxID=2802971 RepID=UPI001AF4D9AD|nr:non-canonical purine NTP pyrophosphatase [Luteitalea sp. TBR-22]BCS32307.1 non-canonical purine NTP pyrophosphatase [Luteitalea sp. TBR-22]